MTIRKKCSKCKKTKVDSEERVDGVLICEWSGKSVEKTFL